MPIFNDIMEHELIGPAIRRGLKQGMKKGMKQGREQGMEQGLDQGRKEGLRKGRQQGKREGARTLVLHQIEKRFGKLTPAQEKKLAVLAPPDLNALALRVLDAKSPKELFQSR